MHINCGPNKTNHPLCSLECLKAHHEWQDKGPQLLKIVINNEFVNPDKDLDVDSLGYNSRKDHKCYETRSVEIMVPKGAWKTLGLKRPPQSADKGAHKAYKKNLVLFNQFIQKKSPK